MACLKSNLLGNFRTILENLAFSRFSMSMPSSFNRFNGSFNGMDSVWNGGCNPNGNYQMSGGFPLSYSPSSRSVSHSNFASPFDSGSSLPFLYGGSSGFPSNGNFSNNTMGANPLGFRAMGGGNNWGSDNTDGGNNSGGYINPFLMGGSNSFGLGQMMGGDTLGSDNTDGNNNVDFGKMGVNPFLMGRSNSFGFSNMMGGNNFGFGGMMGCGGSPFMLTENQLNEMFPVPQQRSTRQANFPQYNPSQFNNNYRTSSYAGTNKGMCTTPLDYSPEALRNLESLAGRLNMDPNDLKAVIYAESGGRADAVNSSSGATGLIQFMPRTANGLGISTAAIREMSAEEQLKPGGIIEQYFRDAKGMAGFDNNQQLNGAEVYSLVFAPANARKGILYAEGSSEYNANPGPARIAKANGHSGITSGDLAEFAGMKTKADSSNTAFA